MNHFARPGSKINLDIHWPAVVEVEVNSECNRTCPYCPNGRPQLEIVKSRMDKCLFQSIIRQLKVFEFSGRLSFHLYNEPLLRVDLEEFIYEARQHLPFSHIVLYTNGDFLTEKRYTSLIATGVDYFIVTRHGREHMAERPNQLVRIPEELDLSGRAGAVKHQMNSLTRVCYAPMEMMIITVNGEVILCHEDARREEVIGNITHASIAEVWQCERFQNIRQHLMEGRRDRASAVCTRCDHKAYPGPNMTM